MEYRIKLRDLREHDGMYYIADILDVDGSGWVDKEMALKTIDMINAEICQPVFNDFAEDLFYYDEF